MDIMVDIGEIWRKLSDPVMVHIHWRTPTTYLARIFNPAPPTPYGKILVEQPTFLGEASLNPPLSFKYVEMISYETAEVEFEIWRIFRDKIWLSSQNTKHISEQRQRQHGPRMGW